MLERILEIIKEKGLTPSQFADEIGVQRSGISHLISGRNKPSLEFIMKIKARFPETDMAWLLQGGEKEFFDGTIPVRQADPSQSTLFETPDVMETQVFQKSEKRKTKTEQGKTIEKIVVFYTDRTYREYQPD
jgi:transcriptional regulator with XRE-family HTH domain